ncbi:MAG TPA: DUF6232 family protein [Anaerolineales bacterium]|nr:DUF6232 family protein [Anaerolineales bacterium]
MQVQIASDKTILKEGNLTVTDRRVTVGAKTYATANIASVRIQENEPRFFLPLFFMLITGICLALIAASDMQDLSYLLNWGMYLSVGAFFLLLFSQKTKYSVLMRMRGSVDEMSLLQTPNRDYAEKVVKMLREAIKHGEKLSDDM